MSYFYCEGKTCGLTVHEHALPCDVRAAAVPQPCGFLTVQLPTMIVQLPCRAVGMTYFILRVHPKINNLYTYSDLYISSY